MTRCDKCMGCANPMRCESNSPVEQIDKCVFFEIEREYEKEKLRQFYIAFTKKRQEIARVEHEMKLDAISHITRELCRK